MAKRKTKSILFAWRRAVLHSQMSRTRRLVLLGFAEHMNAARGDSCWPADGTVGEEVSYSRQTVNTHKKEAIRDGWLLQRPRGKKAESEKSTYEYHAHLPEGHPAWSYLSDDDAAYLERTAAEWRSEMEQDNLERAGEAEEAGGTEEVFHRKDNRGGHAPPSGLSTAMDGQPVNGQEPACQQLEPQPVNGQEPACQQPEPQPAKSGGHANSCKLKQDNDLRFSPVEPKHEGGSHRGSHSSGGSHGGRTRERAQKREAAPPTAGPPGLRPIPPMPRPDSDGHYRCTKGCGTIVGGPRVICAKCHVAAAKVAP